MPVTRTARFEARVSPELLSHIKRAAMREGRSLSDFVMQSARDAADRANERHETMTVSAEDYDRIMDALSRPPKSNAALERAFARHKELIRESR